MSYHCYILTNKRRTVLYTGVTGDLKSRLLQHAVAKSGGFTAKYKVNQLVWCEEFQNIEDAIAAEKRIKSWSRAKKIELIQSKNPQFRILN